jgi:catechol 2,3-dioxygenase-like lactoylglutathione lyase family enzyme
MPSVVLKSAIPILFVRDLAASAAFYRERLGFAVDFLHGTPPFYGAVSRGAACLHLRCVAQPNFAGLAAQEVALIVATIEFSDVQRLFVEFESRGVAFAQAPTRQT